MEPISRLAHFRAELGQKSVKNERSVQKTPKTCIFLGFCRLE